MISCRYFGLAFTEIGDREFDTVGQGAEFSEAMFKDIILGNGCFLPEGDFKALGFNSEELRDLGSAGSRTELTDSFNSKISQAVNRFNEIRELLKLGKDSEVFSYAG